MSNCLQPTATETAVHIAAAVARRLARVVAKATAGEDAMAIVALGVPRRAPKNAQILAKLMWLWVAFSQ